MSEVLQFRQLHAADITQIMVMERELFGADAWSETLYLADLAREDRAWRGLFDTQNSLIGYAGIYLAPQGDLLTIGIGKAYQSLGYGELLLTKMHSVAKQFGVRELFLEVALENEVARGLYRKFGYEELAVRRHYYGHGRHAMVMRRRLTGPTVGPVGAESIT